MSEQAKQAVSRREFLRGTAAVAGGIMAAGGASPRRRRPRGPSTG